MLPCRRTEQKRFSFYKWNFNPNKSNTNEQFRNNHFITIKCVLNPNINLQVTCYNFFVRFSLRWNLSLLQLIISGVLDDSTTDELCVEESCRETCTVLIKISSLKVLLLYNKLIITQRKSFETSLGTLNRYILQRLDQSSIMYFLLMSHSTRTKRKRLYTYVYINIWSVKHLNKLNTVYLITAVNCNW